MMLSGDNIKMAVRSVHFGDHSIRSYIHQISRHIIHNKHRKT